MIVGNSCTLKHEEGLCLNDDPCCSLITILKGLDASTMPLLEPTHICVTDGNASKPH